jgi:hypothetical protein
MGVCYLSKVVVGSAGAWWVCGFAFWIGPRLVPAAGERLVARTAVPRADPGSKDGVGV